MSNDLYQKVTNYIISQLLKIEQTGDNTNWLCPWTGTDPSVFPYNCLLYTSPSPRDRTRSRMPSSA